MKKTKLLPLPVLLIIDLLLIGAVLCTFAYFHHVRTLWGTLEDNSAGSVSVRFTKPPQMTASPSQSGAADSSVVPSTGEAGSPNTEDHYDYSGDFGSTLPKVFLEPGEETISTDTKYQSQDIHMTLTEVNTELQYNGKTYQVQYFVYDIYVRNIENLFTVAVNKREPIKDLIESAAELTDEDGNYIYDGPALAAVNGDYWGNVNHTQLAVRNGALLRESDYISSDICVLYYDGTMETVTPNDFDWDEIASKSPYQIWEFGPALIESDGSARYHFSDANYDSNVVNNRHPRCAIGYYEPGHYCFVVVDGRSDDSDGVRLFQLAEIFEELGCKTAYNFDGGDSCQAYFGEEVVREATGREEQRELYDIVAVGEVNK